MIGAIGSNPYPSNDTQLQPHLWFDTSFATEFRAAAKTDTPAAEPAVTASNLSASSASSASSSETAAAAVTPAAVSNTTTETSVPNGEMPPCLYGSWLPNGQPDLDPAHCAADVLYEGDFIANPKGFDPAAEQAKYEGMSDAQVMGIYEPMEQKFQTECGTIMAQGGPNINSATGLPINWVTFYQQVDAGLAA